MFLSDTYEDLATMANLLLTEPTFVAGGGELLQDLGRVAFTLAGTVILRLIVRFLAQSNPATVTLVSRNDSETPVLSTPTVYE